MGPVKSYQTSYTVNLPSTTVPASSGSEEASSGSKEGPHHHRPHKSNPSSIKLDASISLTSGLENSGDYIPHGGHVAHVPHVPHKTLHTADRHPHRNHNHFRKF